MTGTITAREFDLIREFIEKETSISLAEDKVYLVETRLSKIMKREDIDNYSELHRALQDSRRQALRDEVIDAMTTNETLWFRDTSPFDAFREHLLPAYANEIREGRRNKIRIWSAASSTGQEAYSLAMVFREAARSNSSLKMEQLHILGTDLSDSALAKARAGIYSGIAMDRGLPGAFRERYFQPLVDGYRITPEIRDRVVFRKFNLQDSFVMMGSFDIILTRYVLIYFQDEFKREVLRKAHGALDKGGVLFLGSSESLPGGTAGYALVRRGRATWYQKIDANHQSDRAVGVTGRSPSPATAPSVVAAAAPMSAPVSGGSSTEGLDKATHDLSEIMRRLQKMNAKYDSKA